MVITSVRLPDDLHARLRQHADANMRSLNAEILYLLTRALDAGL